jgi:hypothetical protein
MPQADPLWDPKCKTRNVKIKGTFVNKSGVPVARLFCRGCGRRWIRLLRDLAALGGDVRKKWGVE